MEHAFTNSISFKASLFRTDSFDLIAYQRGADLISRPVNIDEAYRQGVEITWYVEWKRLNLEMDYLLQQSKNKDNGQELTYVPRHSGKITASTTLWSTTRLEATLRAESEQFSDLENSPEDRLAGYATLDAKLIVPVKLWGLSSEIFAHGYNLLDRRYEVHQGYPDEGIRAIAGVNISW